MLTLKGGGEMGKKKVRLGERSSNLGNGITGGIIQPRGLQRNEKRGGRKRLRK